MHSFLIHNIDFEFVLQQPYNVEYQAGGRGAADRLIPSVDS